VGIRAMVKYLDQVPGEDIVCVNIPTGIPLVYELDAELRPLVAITQPMRAVDNVASNSRAPGSGRIEAA